MTYINANGPMTYPSNETGELIFFFCLKTYVIHTQNYEPGQLSSQFGWEKIQMSEFGLPHILGT